MDRSWDMLNQGKTHAALTAARQALEINRNAPDAHNLIGYIHALDGEFETALEHYRQAMDLDEWYLEPVLNAAEILAHPEADPREAIRLCRSAVENMELTTEEMADAALIEVEALMSLNDEVAVRNRIHEIQDVETLPDMYQVTLGRALYECGDLEGAGRFVRRALDVDTPAADAWYLLGLLMREQGNRIEAVKAFLATRSADLLLPRVPWQMSETDLIQSVRAAILALPPDARDMLSEADITVLPYPTTEMIIDEQDPRQILRLSQIDPAREIFSQIVVFELNVERMISPIHQESDLARCFANELGFPIARS
jgi:tetratricopeptide (TPR) repeat protein